MVIVSFNKVLVRFVVCWSGGVDSLIEVLRMPVVIVFSGVVCLCCDGWYSCGCWPILRSNCCWIFENESLP